LNDYPYLLYSSEELVKGDLALVVDVEELEGAGHECLFSHRLWAALGNFLSEISLETR